MSGRFQVVYADPPWRYSDRGCNGAAEGHYSTMTLAQICAMPIAKLAAPDSVLFLWATYPLLREALQVIDAWGFQYKSIAFQWVKTYKPAPDGTAKPTFGLGRWTRGNTEPCLLATRGKPKRAGNDVSQLLFSEHELIVAPLTRHSAKPPETREKIVRLMGDVPRLELFARERAPGWVSHGNDPALQEAAP
jgi:N6-adenosine-specific RNA methylase IME4